MEFWTQSPEETEALGAALASSLRPGQVVAFRGPLGAGKTAFTLFHFDMYRLSSEEDLFDIGWEDYLDRGGLCVVEWSERVFGALGSPVTVTIEKIPGSDQQRKITIEGVPHGNLSL